VAYPRLGPLDRLRPASNSEDRRAAMSASAPVGSSFTSLATSLFAESWGPVWEAAAQCGLQATGPLLLPGSWTFS
jgi:protease-4